MLRLGVVYRLEEGDFLEEGHRYLRVDVPLVALLPYLGSHPLHAEGPWYEWLREGLVSQNLRRLPVVSSDSCRECWGKGGQYVALRPQIKDVNTIMDNEKGTQHVAINRIVLQAIYVI